MPRLSHSEYVLQQLNNQREWGFLCDCCIIINDIYFRAHRAVLTACSSYFRMMFISQQLTGNLSLSNVNISAECFDLILQIMYLGKLVGVPSDFEELRSAMTFLQLYYVPKSLDELQQNDGKAAPSPPVAVAQPKGAMMFGVRMYEERPGELVKRRRREPSPEVNGLSAAPTVAPPLPSPAATITTTTTMEAPARKQGRPGLKGRLHPRFGKCYTCDCCGFVFSCEKLLNEHALTCNSRRAPAPPEGPEREGEPVKAGPSGRPGSAEPPLASPEENGTGSGRPPVKTEPDDTAAVDLHDITVVQVADDGELASDDDEEKALAFEGAGGLRGGRGHRPSEGHPNWAAEEDEEEDDDEEEEEEEEGRTLKLEPQEGRGSPLGPACELCGVALPESERAGHYVAHHVDSVCACGKCGRLLVKGGRLQEHAERCLGGHDALYPWQASSGQPVPPSTPAPPGDSPPGPQLARFTCQVCGGSFKQRYQLQEHMYRHVGRHFQCSQCARAFDQEKLWVEHISRCMFGQAPRETPSERVDRRKHVCNLCGKAFYQRCHLREHFTTHTKEKEFACQICGKEFLRERLLRLHLDMHRGDARYVCPRCGQGSYRKHDHLRHMVSHLVGREVICEVCFQVFEDGELLERHTDVHLHTCTLCGDKFKLKKDLTMHHLTSHTKKL
ncbi:zinc finger and BTB domain-containing protein 1 [Chiloscyllium punctatum]|uniref:Zinc finger and BTB domain-containing protein 1 n=1 Tax=Chiloscyllium punctatum TaxID=137246 RepID=A0A401RNI0_CHIPU|nr:hypothetical protein [Chiloscyllium punctatum]